MQAWEHLVCLIAWTKTYWTSTVTYKESKKKEHVGINKNPGGTGIIQEKENLIFLQLDKKEKKGMG